MIRDDEVLIVEEPKLTAAERLYLPQILSGMWLTFKHFLRFGRRMTVQYPEQKRELRIDNYRGIHRLNRDEQGRVACVACFMCSTACPADCIEIVAGEAPWPDREKYPVKFEIDELRCIFCGMCEAACPVDAIELTTDYFRVSETREQLLLDKEALLESFDNTVGEMPRKNPRIAGYDNTGDRPEDEKGPKKEESS